MQTKKSVLWIGLALLILSGCIRPVYNETPTATQEAAPAFSPVVTPTPVPPPNLYLDPPVVEIEAGETTTIRVRIDNAQRMNGILLDLSFDPSVIAVEDADPETEGVQLSPGEIPHPVQVAQNEALNGPGHAFYQVSLESGAVVNGSGVVVSLILRGVAVGSSPLILENGVIFDPDGTPLELMPLASGLVTVVGQPASEPTSSPVPQPPPQQTTQPTPQPTPQPSASSAIVGIYYVVQPGENLYRIGLKFGTTPEAIGAASDIADINQVQAGTMILVPVAPPQGSAGYYVHRGDTLYSIARRFGMTAETLASLNGIGITSPIAVGELLIVTP